MRATAKFTRLVTSPTAPERVFPSRGPAGLARNLMKRCQRMTEGREFARLRREGRSHPGRYLVLSTMNDASAIAASPFRVGLITTKKLGNAVARNRIRRRLRAIVDEFANRFVPGTQLVIIARYRAPVASYQALREDWKRLAKRAGVLRRTPEVGLCVEPGDAHPPSIS